MIDKREKIFITMSIIIFLILVVPATFAVSDNSTDNNYVSMEKTVKNSQKEKTIRSNPNYGDIYFDASSTSTQEDGSASNPYKKFTADKIKNNSNIHIKNGVYNFSGRKDIYNVSILGESRENTIVSTATFNNKANMDIFNITLKNSLINNIENLSVVDSTFIDSDNSNIVSIQGNVSINNCQFINSTSKSGGSVDMDSGVININNSVFINNSADYGAGILLRFSSLNISNSLISGNYADTFGSGITSIYSDINMKNITFTNNRAKYDGGSLFMFNGSSNITDSLFKNNTGRYGGAILLDEIGPLSIINNTFESNYATKYTDIYLITCNRTNRILEENTFMNLSSKIEDNIYDIFTPNLNIGNNDYMLIISNASYNDSLPSSYDLRKLGYVTPVKDQGSGGNCWAFAVLGSLESAILKATNVTYDFSEENFKNVMAQFSDYGWTNRIPNTGGNSEMGLGYITSWLGPVNEIDEEYSPTSLLSPVLPSVVHVQNIAFLSRKTFTDNDEIKRAVINYGGVLSGIGIYTNYFKGSNYYCNNPLADLNHQVVIVGWDDNYSRDNFRHRPSGDGAWIVKNSWGTTSGDNGYLYISYYDTTHALYDLTYAFIFNDSTYYEKNYQYDIPGYTDYFLSRNTTAWYKNRFTATGNEYLEAVSTYFRTKTDYEITVQVNNKVKLVQNASTSAGYYTIPLKEKIALHNGDVFEIIFKISQEDESAIPISENISLKKLLYKEGISFVSYDGITWTDFFNLSCSYENTHTYYSQVACIKAFTKNMNVTLKLSADGENPCQISANVIDQYNNTINYGKVKFIVAGEEITVNIVDSEAKLYKILPTGTNSIYAEFNQEGYNNATNSTEIIVTYPEEIKLNIDVLYEDNLSLKVFIVDKYGEKDNGQVIFRINGKTLRDDTGNVIYVDVKSGVASLEHVVDSSWLDTTVNISSIYCGDEYQYITNSTLSKITRKVPTITIDPITTAVKSGSNVTLKAKVILEEKPLTSGRVVFKINGKTLKDENGKYIYLNVDSNGEVILDYNIGKCKAKDYIVTAVYTSNDYVRVEDTTTLKVVK